MADARTVLVTGANSGIGLQTAITLAKRGFDTIGTVRSEAKAELLEKAAADAGTSVRTELLDVTDAEACERVVSAVGPLYGLVNNAGYGMTGAIEDVDDGEARQILETMVLAPMRLARLAIPGMRERGAGRIVNVSSMLGRVTAPLIGWYQGSKHAVEALSDALRMEVAKDGIQVILVEPGGFKTNIWEDLERDMETRRGSEYTGNYERMGSMMKYAEPLMGNPQQCADVIAGALSTRLPRARYLVGLDAQLVTTAQRFTPTFLRDRFIRLAQGL